MKYFERVIFIEDVLHFFTVFHYIMIDLVIIKCLEQCDCFIGSLVLFCFFTLNVACISEGVCDYSKGAFHLSELNGQKLAVVMGISFFIKTTQPDQSNPKECARRRWFFSKTLGKSRFHCQINWSGSGPADQFWQMESALRLHSKRKYQITVEPWITWIPC